MTATGLKVIASAIPEELCIRAQWVAHSLVWNEARQKYDKQPFNVATGELASTTNPQTWGSFADVIAAYKEGRTAGPGFVFTADDPYAGIDLDGCYDPETDELAPWAFEIVKRFESYTELSPSGTGIHIIIRGTLPGAGRNTPTVEVYDQARFFTMTGQVFEGYDVIHERSSDLEDFYRSLPANQSGVYRVETDADLVARAKIAANGEKFTRLWEADDCDYGGDASAGDLALSNMLVFWCEGDTLRADKLFRQSKRVRDKWDKRHYGSGETYGEHTMAVAFTTWRAEHAADNDTIETAVAEPAIRNDLTAFPIGVLPKVVCDFSFAWAAELHTLPEIVAISCIAFASGAIGTTREIRITPQYTETALIWASMIAPPGSAKSAAIRNAGGPLTQFNAKQMRDFDKAKKDYKWAVTHRARGSEPPTPPEPPKRRLFNNTTWEALGKISSEDPHGGIALNDELAGWVLSMNQYKAGGKGSDRPAWMSNWSGEPVVVDRVREDGSYFIEKPFVSVLGSIQPELLSLLTNELGNDGFLGRFIFVNVPRLPKKVIKYNAIPEVIQRNWYQTLETLLTYEVPVLVTMRPAAFEAFQAGSAWAAEQSNALSDDSRMQDFYYKSERTAARLALVLHCIQEASGEVKEDSIEPATVTAAWELMRYFASTMKYVIFRIDESDEDRNVETLVSYALEHGGSVTVKDAQHDHVARIKKATDMKTLFLAAQDRGFGKVSTEAVAGGPRYTFTLNASDS